MEGLTKPWVRRIVIWALTALCSVSLFAILFPTLMSGTADLNAGFTTGDTGDATANALLLIFPIIIGIAVVTGYMRVLVNCILDRD